MNRPRSPRTMSWQKHTFLWIIFCATCQITCSKMMIVGHNLSVYSGDTGCPAVQLTCRPGGDTLTKNFCIMNVKQEASSMGNCTTESGDTFHFAITSNGSEYEVMMNETVRDITMLFLPDQLQYLPSNVDQNLTGKKESKYVLQVSGTQTKCVSCIKPSKTTSSSEASGMMDNLENIADKMERNNQSIKPIVMGGVKGLVYRQDRSTEPKDVTMFSSSDQDEISVTEAQNIGQKQYSWLVKISAEAFNKSRLENNGSAFVGVLQFKNMDVNDEAKHLIVLNNEVYGISMGASISNLTDNIEIFIRAENLVGDVYCSSWDGRGNLMWTTFGCVTEFNTTIIKCSCSHLTFFAVRTTGPNSVTSMHEKSWTLYIGCGLIAFLLLIGLFTFVPFRKNRSNQSTMIAMDSQVCRSSCN
ncbi:adhesion G-protein coupled receptor G1-like isoform X2 [Triplophysa rosa]|uniref:adhesion G-protein coupled receptor G1-like isoform X2 n=1 Tax=Triplophysa rosa TaxID=992332 RepID=UPI002545FC83|nr:adhesion G-protein coupled receptor G1-like isoform X2 [Triplophysa rosa]